MPGQIVGQLYQIPLGISNAFLFDRPLAHPEEGLTLVDTGVPGKAGEVLEAIRALGRQPAELKQILLTHGHADHIGSAAELQRATGAAVYVHDADAAQVRSGTGFRPLMPAPGLKNHVVMALVRMFVVKRFKQIEPTTITGSFVEGDRLPFAGGLRVIHAPGHCAGQVCFLWEEHGGVLLAADTCGHQGGLDLSIGYEDVERGRADLQRISTFAFETACFGHGKPLRPGASRQFAEKFGR